MTWYRSKNLKHSWCYQNSPLYLQCLVLIETRWFLLFLKRMRKNLAKPLYLFFQIMSTVTASPKMTHTPTDAPTTANTAEVSPWSTGKTFINSDIRLLRLLQTTPAWTVPSDWTSIWVNSEPTTFVAVQVTLWPCGPVNSDTVMLPLCWVVVLKGGKTSLLPSTVQEMTALGLASAWHTHCSFLFCMEQNKPCTIDGESEMQGKICDLAN